MPHGIQLPANYSSITVIAEVKGVNENLQGYHANVFGMDWLRRYTYDRIQMEKDITEFTQFGLDENVPIMSLEFGVIMVATESQGHLTWLRDFTAVLDEHQIHGGYHSYRGFDDNASHRSFGIFQCWGKTASECPSDRQFEFVLSGLSSWMRKSTWQPAMLLLLE